jgi:hypothetical protein
MSRPETPLLPTARVLDVIDRLPAPALSAADPLTRDNLMRQVRDQLAQDGRAVTDEALQQAVTAHLQVHPLALTVQETPAVKGPTLPGWGRPNSLAALRWRRRMPAALWGKAMRRLAQGWRSDVRWITWIVVVTGSLGALTWGNLTVKEIVPVVMLPIGMITAFITIELPWIPSRVLVALAKWLGPQGPDPLRYGGDLSSVEMDAWKPYPEVLRYVQVCQQSRLPDLLSGDIGYINTYIRHARSRANRQDQVSQNRALVNEALGSP